MPPKAASQHSYRFSDFKTWHETGQNCSAVKAAGAAPIYRGDPGYSGKLDRDGDGVACES
ncbi:excalibur calcium-binding domain-containing protein [Glutamicibacter ardleyensis]|uniref:excalibur calcium-binding domain-containing protein n=1 Tax=Glutamicibacter ardleyensis TaxID=225894 RepID=UPI003FD35362